MSVSHPEAVTKFIDRWQKSGGSEKANYALFLTELCDLIGVPHPDPAGAETAKNLYVFERSVTHKDSDGPSATGFIDLYKAGSFVLETKQGTFSKAREEGTLLHFIQSKPQQKTGHGKRGTAAFDKVLQRAYNQARKYITALPPSDGRPPFLIVCDVGHSIDLYAEFSGTGGQYERFPDPISHRISLEDLAKPETRELLRKVWTDPFSLDPSKHSAAVTREVAKSLAELAKSLEKDGHDPQVTAGFLQRCLFTMFAEDVELLPKNSFLDVMNKVKNSPEGFPIMLSTLWKDMATGTKFSTVLMNAVPHFNGGLFEDTTALPLRPDQMALLIHAAKSDWSAVEPAIFGTLVERALDPRERHKLGAHYTPRSYVERLIRPALIDPLRAEWEAVKAAASLASEKAEKAEAADAGLVTQASAKAMDKTKAAALGKKRNDLIKQAAAFREEAIGAVRDFHRKICSLKVLDPACGSGNFLYVSLELMKRLEAEVLEAYVELGGDAAFEMSTFKIGPRQFLGLEINRRAVAIAQLVLWIGFFQWQRKTTGRADTNERPLLPKEQSIVQQDAVLAYDKAIPRVDPTTGNNVTIWDGITTKPHPITGKEVPDESARKTVFDYTNPKRAEWPQADVIVGNPPFIGASRMRDTLGDGYTETLRKAWKGLVPESADFVMYWWQKAAELVRDGELIRFGFITTNSIHQTFNRRVIETFLANENKPLHLSYAIPDHPWVDSADGAAVSIALTVAAIGKGEGVVERVTAQTAREDGENEVILTKSEGIIVSNLQIGTDPSSCRPLSSNLGITNTGVKLHGAGFIISKDNASDLGLGRISGLEKHIRHYRHGKDLAQTSRGAMVIDLNGLPIGEVQSRFPEVYQWVVTHVKPERDHNNEPYRRNNWWLFGRKNTELRSALRGLTRFIATVETSKHRFFTFLDKEILPDNMLVAIATPDSALLGVLSCTIHVTWALVLGGNLGGNTPRYNKTQCFEPFPFPILDESPLKQRIRDLGERLDDHRKKQQELHPDLTLTGMYNVLEAVRAGTPLTAKEKAIHDKGLVSILKQIHDDLDAAVFEAYGWQDLHEALVRLAAGEFYDWETGLITHYDLDASAGAYDKLVEEHREKIEQELLTRLVALNHARAEEERNGLIRWLRPEYQNPQGHTAPEPTSPQLPGTQAAQTIPSVPPAAILSWPAGLAAQVIAIQKLLLTSPSNPEILSAHFGKKSTKRIDQIQEILEMLKGLGQL